ncbi:MAG: exopolyphosphatase [Synergistaceae bacterium]|nr:exopolyphosphatase [Synergistaceae bacterium]
MQKLGIIDIGSNSMRVIIVQINTDGSFRVLDEQKESVRLGEKTNCSCVLSEEKIETAIEALKLFIDLCEALEVTEYICVATEAVRRALNKTQFVERVKTQLGLEVRVISGQEEAFYDYFGVVNTMDIPDALIVDIGGSSTEIILASGRNIERSVSLPFGAITLSQMFGLKDRISKNTQENLHGFLHEKLGKLEWLRGNRPIVGVGGSFRNIGKIDRKRTNYPLDITHNYPLSSDSLLNIYEMISESSMDERKGIKGLSADRSDIIPGALSEIAVLTEITGIKEIVISGSGIREGLFYEYLLKSREPVDDVLDFSLQNIINNYRINKVHAYNVWKLALKLFSQLKNKFELESGCINILKASALLHDYGTNLSYYDHHKHSFYQILNSRINGLTQKEIIMAAEVALLHRKDNAKITAPFGLIFSDHEKNTIRRLGVIVGIAESLDRRQNGNINDIDIIFDKNSVKIIVSAGINPRLEIKDALSAKQRFQRVFRHDLHIEELQQI